MNLLERLLGVRAKAHRRRRTGEGEQPALEVLFEVDSLEPGERARGLASLLASLDRKSFSATVAIARSASRLEPSFASLGLEARPFGGEVERLGEIAGERQVDLVVSLGAVAGAQVARRSGAAHVQVIDRAEPWIEKEARRELKRACRGADLVVARSPVIADWASRRLGARADRLQLVPPGIAVDGLRAPDVSERAEARRALGIADDALVFLGVGDFAPRSGHALLLQAIEGLAARRRGCLALCAGDPVDAAFLDSCRALAARGKARSMVRPIEALEELQPLFRAADFFVQPVGVDGLRAATLEALARGLPLVVASTADARELLRDPAPGVLFPELADWSRLGPKALPMLGQPEPQDARPLGFAMEQAANDAERLRQQAGSQGRHLIEGLYAADAAARCFEGALLAAVSG